MSEKIKYFVFGKFEGSFKTFQNLNLAFGDSFPEDGKHLIRIYRGIISNTNKITPSQFENIEGEISLSSVNNIQINTSVNWPEQNDRIFHLSQLKLRKVSISGIQTINKQTYGNIHAEIYASVSEQVFSDLNDISEENKTETPIHGHETDESTFDNKEGDTHKNTNKPDKNKGETSSDNGSGGDSSKIQKKKWDLSIDPSILKWIKRISWILLIIFLILLFTKWGEQLICRFKRNAYQQERIELIKDRLKMEATIERTRPKKSQCGSQVEFDGESIPQEYVYTLGTISGDVIINYDMYIVPDRIEVSFNGKAVAETNDSFLQNSYRKWENKGFTDSSGILVFRYNYMVNEMHELTIKVIPNPDIKTTKWKFNVKCPQ
jgi:hypothetical protein